jgi:hypothetical protein
MLGRRSRAVIIVAAGLSAGVLASAGLAATADDTSPSKDAAADETTVQQDEGTVLDVTPTSTGTERFWGPECGDGEPTTHGGYVASTERDGETRSTAAQSPCGKPLSSLNESGDDDEGDDDEVEIPETETGDDESGDVDSHATETHGASGESHGRG